MNITDFSRGDRVHVKGWGSIVFTVEGYGLRRGWQGETSDGVKVRSGSLSGLEDPDDLTHVDTEGED